MDDNGRLSLQSIVTDILVLLDEAGYDDSTASVTIVIDTDGTLIFEIGGIDDETRRVVYRIVEVVMEEHGIAAHDGLG
jgi:hypothetical protein